MRMSARHQKFEKFQYIFDVNKFVSDKIKLRCSLATIYISNHYNMFDNMCNMVVETFNVDYQNQKVNIFLSCKLDQDNSNNKQRMLNVTLFR